MMCMTQEPLSDRLLRLAALGEEMAGFAHDGRNAVNLTKLSAELLKAQLAQNAEALEKVELIERAQNELAQLYEEVCDFVSQNRHKVQMLDVRRSWRDAWERLSAARREKGMSLREELCDEDIDLRVMANPLAMRRVWCNILQNAIQASPPGASVQVRCRGTTVQGRSALEVSIVDQGLGMTREQRRRIFAPFFTTKQGGTGLGMAIARRIVEELGGSILVADRDGPGAEISVILPRPGEGMS